MPKIALLEGSGVEWQKVDCIAIPVSIGEKVEVASSPLIRSIEKELEISIADLASQWPDMSGKPGELIELPVTHHKFQVTRIFLVGVGGNSADDQRKAAVSLARKVKSSGKKVLDLLVQDKKSVTVHAVALSLASYLWSQKTEKKSDEVKQATFYLTGKFTAEIERAQILASAVWRARDLIHTPPNIKTPAWMALQAKSYLAKSKNASLSIQVKSGAALKEFGGLRAVGNSSPTPGPRLIEISYAPRGSKNWPHVVFVGKGITFDTGGVSLKRPYDLMIGMKSDMSGAAAVMSSTFAAAEIGARVRVTALLMCAENAISATAQRPSDVITHFGGTTVEVLDTDAEGRLVLADGLAYAAKELKPDYLIDIATLTGSATLGLGRQYGAMYTRDQKLAQQFHDLGNETGERVWQMPLIDDYSVAMKSDIADLNHTADKGDFSAGSVTAALFLEHFAGDCTWVHFDIAGTARSENDSGENPKGGTGFGVRLLTQWLASF
jgi:leucyl aminopeptidase